MDRSRRDHLLTPLIGSTGRESWRSANSLDLTCTVWLSIERIARLKVISPSCSHWSFRCFSKAHTIADTIASLPTYAIGR